MMQHSTAHKKVWAMIESWVVNGTGGSVSVGIGGSVSVGAGAAVGAVDAADTVTMVANTDIVAKSLIFFPLLIFRPPIKFLGNLLSIMYTFNIKKLLNLV